jgi:hypothetical protein
MPKLLDSECTPLGFFFEPKTAREAPAVEILLRKTKGVTIITCHHKNS